MRQAVSSPAHSFINALRGGFPSGRRLFIDNLWLSFLKYACSI